MPGPLGRAREAMLRINFAIALILASAAAAEIAITTPLDRPGCLAFEVILEPIPTSPDAPPRAAEETPSDFSSFFYGRDRVEIAPGATTHLSRVPCSTPPAEGDRQPSCLGIVSAGGPTGVHLAVIHVHSPADRAGLQPNDVLLRFNSGQVHSVPELVSAILPATPGEGWEAVVLRGEEILTISGTFGHLVSNQFCRTQELPEE